MISRFSIPLLFLVTAPAASDDLLLMEQELLFPNFPGEPVQVETRSSFQIMGTGLADQESLVSFFLEQNPDADRAKVTLLASLYIEESAAEGVNSDIAFVQMCLETGFLRFQGLVVEEMNNFCGLGAISPQQPGLYFPDERTGVRAHIQHLKAYGSTESPVGEIVDPRFQFVTPRGKSPDIFGLSGTWATDPQYGAKLADLLEKLFS